MGYKEKICTFACMEVRDFLRQRVGGELTEAEERILREMGEGKVIDFLGERQVDMRQKVDREAAQAWGSAQRVRAEFLYWLVVWPDFQRLIHPKGLALRGVHVEGKLDFEGAQLLHRLFIEDSYLPGGLSLVEARSRTLSLEGSYLPGLWARRARIEGDLRLESALIEPPQPPQPLEASSRLELHGKEALFPLEEAVVQGDLDLDAVWMRYPRHIALYAKALRVEGSLYLRKAHIEGTVYLVEAQISADLRAQGLSISSVPGGSSWPGGHAFVASLVRIGGDTLLDDTEVSKEAYLDFGASRLGGNLSLRKVRAKGVELPKVQVQGSLDISGAHIERLRASEMILRGDLRVEEGTARLILDAAQVEGNISLQSVRGSVWAEGLTLKGTLKVKNANLKDLNILKGLNIEEARVEGNVELSEVHLEEEINAERLVLGGDLRLMGVLVRKYLKFRGAQVGGKFEARNIKGDGISAQGMQIGKSLIWEEIETGNVYLGGTRVGEDLKIESLTCYQWKSDEMMVIGEAHISWVMRLDKFSWERGKVSGRLEISYVVTDALSLQGTRVDEGLEVERVRVGDAVDLEGFQGGGDLLITACILGGAPYRPGLSLKRAEIAGEVRIMDSSILSGLDAEKLHAHSLYVERMFLTGGVGIWSDSPAFLQLAGGWAGGLSLKDAQLEERAYFRDVNIMGPVSLRYAQMQTLEIVVKQGWGKEGKDSGMGLSPLVGWVDLHGISVSRWVFSGPAIEDKDRETRLRLFSAWLRRQLPHYSAHPYENLAKALKAEADENAALRILIQKEDDVGLARSLHFLKRFWRWILRYAVGHGYRPEWALRWILAFIAVGAFLFELGYSCEVIAPASTDVLVQEMYQKYRKIPKDYPPFSAWAYSIDAFVPFLDLVLERYWIPNADAGWFGAFLRIYLWFHIVVGWLLSSLFLTGLTGIIRRLE